MFLHMYMRMVANTKLGLQHRCKVQHQCKVHHSNRDECEKDSSCEHLYSLIQLKLVGAN